MGRLLAVLALTAGAVGCADDKKKKEQTCTVEDATSCKDGLVCEKLGSGDEHACLAPVLVTGRVFDALDEQGIAGRRSSVSMRTVRRERAWF